MLQIYLPIIQIRILNINLFCLLLNFEWNHTMFVLSGNKEHYEAILVLCILPVEWTLNLPSWAYP